MFYFLLFFYILRCQTDRSEMSGNTRGKWNNIFRLSGYSERNKWTTSRGDPEYSIRKKPKGTFLFEFRPKFPESLHNGVSYFSTTLVGYEIGYTQFNSALGASLAIYHLISNALSWNNCSLDFRFGRFLSPGFRNDCSSVLD